MSYSDNGLTNSKMEWSFLISVLMMVILTNYESDFVEGRVDGVERRVDDNPIVTNSCPLLRWLNEPTYFETFIFVLLRSST